MIPHYPQLIAGLVDEPYSLSMNSIAQLTLRQIVGIYYRERDEHGKPLPLPYGVAEQGDERTKAVKILIAMGFDPEDARNQVYGSK